MRKISQILSCIVLMSVFGISSCDNEPIDPAIIINPQPDPTCEEPSALQVSDFVSGTMVNVTWEAGAGETSWEVQYGSAGFSAGNGTSVYSSDTNVSIASLNPAGNYHFYVRSLCGTNSFSEWTGPVSVNSSNENCPNPGGVTAVRGSIVNTTVDVSWTAGGEEGAWEIQYGPSGFQLGSGTVVPATTTVKQVAGITVDGTYHFYVRAICSSSQSSSWVGPITVGPVGTTPGGFSFMNANIDGIQYNNMKPLLYPITGAMANYDEIVDDNDVTQELLKMQGHTDAMNPGSTNFAEITLRLHKDYWAPGTYELVSVDSGADWPKADVNLIMVMGTNTYTVYENELPGTITVTEFNAATMRIKGTFQFTYMLSDEGNETGPFNVTGNFDYPIDPDAF